MGRGGCGGGGGGCCCDCVQEVEEEKVDSEHEHEPCKLTLGVVSMNTVLHCVRTPMCSAWACSTFVSATAGGGLFTTVV